MEKNDYDCDCIIIQFCIINTCEGLGSTKLSQSDSASSKGSQSLHSVAKFVVSCVVKPGTGSGGQDCLLCLVNS